LEKNNKNTPCGACIIGLVFALLEILIVIGETIGWINYNSGLDSTLFIIFLISIILFHNKKYNSLISKRKRNMEK